MSAILQEGCAKMAEPPRVSSTSAAPHPFTRLEVAVSQAVPHSSSSRTLSVRTRFEIFKRDDFTCRYCGRTSPEVVLQVDHIVPRAAGGSDDPLNLATSCWECNSGKSDVPLGRVMTGEDPYDKAIELMERERQVREYNRVLEAERERREDETWRLVGYWNEELGVTGEDRQRIARPDYYWLKTTLRWCPSEVIRGFMELALARGYTRNLRWVGACVRNWRTENGLDPDPIVKDGL